ncbi:MAG: GGDEF domain-containing phosphodiesterase [Acetatifactor sp.]|nr:GGDEF domain-containing phosphodiesterase [Acetatifactor sp.]
MSNNRQMDSIIDLADRQECLRDHQDAVRQERDTLTGLYTFSAAKERINELMERVPQGAFHVIVLHIGNISQLIDEYGFAFAMAVLENQAVLLQRCFQRQGEVIFSRLGRDAMMAFWQWENDGEAEEHCRLVQERLQNRYFGRREKLRCRVTVGVYHVPGQERDLKNILSCVGKAVGYGMRCRIPCVVYGESMTDETVQIDESLTAEGLDEEQLMQYDSHFIAFAVSLLSDSMDLDSNLDMLIKRVGWHFGYDEVLISEFIEDNSTMVSNKWRRSEGVLPNPEEINAFDVWDDFFSCFDKDGINLTCDVEKGGYSERDLAFFHERGIGSFINLLFYGNGRPIGYMTCSRHGAIERISDRELHTLIQLSKVISSFVALRFQNRQNQEHIETLRRDELTGLYHYGAFQKEVRRALYQRDPGLAYAMVYMDVSNFAYLNENFGYSEGNQLLKDMARWLRYMNAKRCICGRVHADRFVILVTGESQEAIEEEIRQSVSRFSDYLLHRYPMGNLQVRAGLYYIDNPEAEIFTMIDAANHARKIIKDDYLNPVMVYTERLRRTRDEKINVVASIHDAIDKGDVEAYLQPKFSMRTGDVVGAEALVRWHNADGSMKYPDQFIPVLEEVGYIVNVDFCVFRQVLVCLKRWKAEGRKRVPISVNFSRVHFRDQHFCDKVLELLREYEVEPEYIEIEVTESCISGNSTGMVQQMTRLRENGLKIAMDDFGIGYSSLGMLKDANVDIVKVDKSFIDHYETDQEQQYINRIGQLVRAAGKDILFEGVETRKQVEFLRDYGYDKAQGYVFSKPVPIPDFEKWMDV